MKVKQNWRKVLGVLTVHEAAAWIVVALQVGKSEGENLSQSGDKGHDGVSVEKRILEKD